MYKMNLKGLILEALENAERQKFIDSIKAKALESPLKKGYAIKYFLRDTYPNETFTPEEIEEIKKAFTKGRLKRYYTTEKSKARMKRYFSSEKGKAAMKRNNISEKGKARNKRYDTSEKGKLKKKRHRVSERGIATRRKRRRERRKTDIEYALKERCRKRFGDFVRSKGKISFGKYVQIDYEKLKNHLESLFKPGMTWENRSNWHIDHIRPLASFKYVNDDGSPNLEEIKVSWAIENLQPLWDKDNIAKGAKWDLNGEDNFKLEDKDLPNDPQ